MVGKRLRYLNVSSTWPSKRLAAEAWKLRLQPPLRSSLCDGSPDLWDGQPLPPATVGDAAGVSHAPAPSCTGGVVCRTPTDSRRSPCRTWHSKRVTACWKLIENDLRPDKRRRLTSTCMSLMFCRAGFFVRAKFVQKPFFEQIPGWLGRGPSKSIWRTNALHANKSLKNHPSRLPHGPAAAHVPTLSPPLDGPSSASGVCGFGGGRTLWRRTSTQSCQPSAAPVSSHVLTCTRPNRTGCRQCEVQMSRPQVRTRSMKGHRAGKEHVWAMFGWDPVPTSQNAPWTWTPGTLPEGRRYASTTSRGCAPGMCTRRCPTRPAAAFTKPFTSSSATGS